MFGRRTSVAIAAVTMLVIIGAAGAASASQGYTLADFTKVRKFDAHVHANTTDPAFLDEARRDNFELLSINVDYPDFQTIDEQFRVARALRKADPARFHFAGTFSMKGFGEPGWSDREAARMTREVAAGALAIKTWKNIGLVERDKAGQLVMLDDRALAPIFAKIQSLGVVWISHQGEPYNCWLPLAAMTNDNDREYFKEHPQYHMFLHPEMPAYETLMAVRDRVVERHPGLRFVGAHMGSLEWSTDRLGKFLDTHPQANVDLAARLSAVQYQSLADRAKVRAFFFRYADRLIYATDLTAAPGDDPAAFTKEARAFWTSDWTYLATVDKQRIDALHRDVPGLGLPKRVIDKIYWSNAQRVFAPMARRTAAAHTAP